MRKPRPGEMALIDGSEFPIVSIGEAGLVVVSYNGLRIDFYPSELEWVESHSCWQQRAISGLLKQTGRPPMSDEDQTMRAGFCVLKKQWVALTAWSALTGKSFSEVVREALDEYMKKRGI